MSTAVATEATISEHRQSEMSRPFMHALIRYAINPVISGILRSPLGGGMTKSLMLLTFRGRKSGKRYTTPVAYFEEDDSLIVFTRAPWWKNLSGGASLTLHLRGRRREAVAETISDDKEAIARYLKTEREKHPSGTRFLGITLDAGGSAAPEEVRQAAERWKVLRITLVIPV